jgi:hypothetical protein
VPGQADVRQETCAVGAAAGCAQMNRGHGYAGMRVMEWCQGNQCCRDGTTCPSADPSFHGCHLPKIHDCTR